MNSKYLFNFIGAGLLIFLILLKFSHPFQRSVKMTEENKILYSSFPKLSTGKNYDPARVQTATESFFVTNIYSSLVEHSDENKIIPGVASNFNWDGDKIVFTIREGIKTIDGYEIDSKDVVLSLKRLLIIGTNTHGDLRNFLAGNTNIKSLEEPLSSITSNGNSVIIKLKDRNKGTFLLPLLTNPDFRILSKHSFLHNKNLEIIDYRNTSGPYYVSSFDDDGTITLCANPYHYYFNKKMPQTIKLIQASGQDAIRLFKKNKIDLIPTIDGSTEKDFKNLSSNENEAVIHKTLNIKARFAKFIGRGKTELTSKQRIYIGKKLREAYQQEFMDEIPKPSNEFFPILGEGSLTTEELNHLRSLFDSTEKPEFLRKIKIGVHPNSYNRYQKAFSKIPEIELISSAKPPWTLPIETQPDIYIGNTDSAFFENISLISYNIETGTFGLNHDEGFRWLNAYMLTEENSERIKKLRELHYYSLSQGFIIPFGHGPYTTILRKPWNIELSPFFGDMSLWKIRLN